MKYVLPKIRHHDPVNLVQDGGDYENNFYYQHFLMITPKYLQSTL